MTEIVFQVEEAPDGGWMARATGESIFTEADSVNQLRERIRDAVACHFEHPDQRPKIIRLHFTSKPQHKQSGNVKRYSA